MRFRQLLDDQTGQDVAEYAFVAAFVGIISAVVNDITSIVSSVLNVIHALGI